MDKLKKALAEKFAKYSNPQKQLRISPDLSKKYNLRKAKYSENDDRFLLCKLHEIGIDAENVYDRIKQKIQDRAHQDRALRRFKHRDSDIFRLESFSNQG